MTPGSQAVHASVQREGVAQHVGPPPPSWDDGERMPLSVCYIDRDAQAGPKGKPKQGQDNRRAGHAESAEALVSVMANLRLAAFCCAPGTPVQQADSSWGCRYGCEGARRMPRTGPQQIPPGTHAQTACAIARERLRRDSGRRLHAVMCSLQVGRLAVTSGTPTMTIGTQLGLSL